MILKISEKACKQLQRLPKVQREKAHKAFSLLLHDYRHPSLKSRKMTGIDCYEARIDYQYRFTFILKRNTVFILSVGPHDVGLGKK